MPGVMLAETAGLGKDGLFPRTSGNGLPFSSPSRTTLPAQFSQRLPGNFFTILHRQPTATGSLHKNSVSLSSIEVATPFWMGVLMANFLVLGGIHGS